MNSTVIHVGLLCERRGLLKRSCKCEACDNRMRQSRVTRKLIGGPCKRSAQRMTSAWISIFPNGYVAVMLSTEKVDGVVTSGQNLQGGQECIFSDKNLPRANRRRAAAISHSYMIASRN